MRTLKIKTKDFGPVAVLHHGDWTGTATVIWHEGDTKHEVELPASLLQTLGKESAAEALKSRVISCIEDWAPGQTS